MTVDRSRTGAAVLGAALALSLAPGCALLPPSTTAETTKEVLNKMPVDLPRRASRAAVLVVYPPQSGPLYDTTLMAYTVKAYEVAYFSRHEWGANPAQMLQPLLVRTMQNTGFFSAVLAPPYAGHHTHALRTEIRELIADFTSEPAVLQLSLRFELIDGATGRIVAIKEIAIREPMRDRTPYASVVAANEATARALQQLAAFVLDQAG